MSSAGSSGVAFRIYALGHPRLEVLQHDTVIKTVGPGKPLALVTYLSLASRHSESRDILCDLLWGDRSPELARRQVRQALWLAKTEIHPELLSATANTVSITAPFSLDANGFLAAIEAGDLTEALELYTGDFFSEYAAPGAGRFEEWASLERTRLRGRFIHAAETCGKQALDSGRFADAISIATRIRSVEPHAQSGWRLLLEARTASGDPIGAVADAEQFEEWLHREEWEPEPSSLVAIRSARRTGKSTPRSPAASDLIAELVGREREFASLSAEWETIQAGGARIVQVAGESGLGKTRLVSDFIARIRASRGKARYVRANYGEREIAFSFAAAIASDLARLAGAGGISQGSAETLLALNPSLTSTFTVASSSESRLTALKAGLALLDLLGAVSDDKAVLLVLDDLHWADGESREAVSVMAARLASERVLVVTTYRPHYSAALAKDGIRTLRLGPLGETGVRALVNSLARISDEEWSSGFVRLLCGSSSGNPLRVLETLRFCLDGQLLVRENDYWQCHAFAALAIALNERAGLGRRLENFPATHTAVLRAIAVAGLPLPRGMLVKAAGIPVAESDQIISNLELNGLLSSDHDTVELCHDSIGEDLIETTDSQTLDRVHLRLGATMAASHDNQWQAKSVQHLARAGAWTAAAHQIAHVLPDSRTRDAVDSGVRLLLGSAGSDDSFAKIRNELPFRFRFPAWRRSAILAAVPILMLGTGFAVKSTKANPTGPTTLVTIRNLSGDTKEITELALDLDRWNPTSSLRTLRKHKATWAGIQQFRHPTPRPGCSCWAAYVVYPDSGEGDIDLVSTDGSRKRLTAARGDDRPMSFSPDGRRLLILTTRWSRVGWSDIGILDLSTGHIARLTHGSMKYDSPSWSPEGTRIVFGRGTNGEPDRAICVMDADGQHQRCFGQGQWTQSGMHGWTGDHQVIISVKMVDSVRVAFRTFDIDRSEFLPSDFPDFAVVTTDPTGTWTISGESGRRGFVRVAPAGRYRAAQVLDSPADVQVVFFNQRLSSAYLDSIAIDSPPASLSVNVPHLLRAIGWNRSRVRMTPTVIHWRSLTPSIANIDSLGVLVARQQGDAVIELSAGGWRLAVDTIPIRSTSARSLLDERWNGNALSRWTPYGEPRPVIQGEDSSFVLNNNGDGNFFSGVYLGKHLDHRRGIAMDFMLSTPITRTQWQVIIAGLGGVSDSRTLAAWDHRTGYLPFMSEFGCWFVYPAGEGEGATRRFSWYDTSYRLHDGHWYRVRLQLFSDLRCGIAINGRAVAITAPAYPRVPAVVPIIQGNNVGSRILVGRLSLFEGVPADVDWSVLQSKDGYQWLKPRSYPRH